MLWYCKEFLAKWSTMSISYTRLRRSFAGPVFALQRIVNRARPFPSCSSLHPPWQPCLRQMIAAVKELYRPSTMFRNVLGPYLSSGALSSRNPQVLSDTFLNISFSFSRRAEVSLTFICGSTLPYRRRGPEAAFGFMQQQRDTFRADVDSIGFCRLYLCAEEPFTLRIHLSKHYVISINF